MAINIGIFVAWPYANGDLHLGHVAGTFMPADTFARYHRMAGNRVLMVSGSDSHGTPVTVMAEAAEMPPEEFFLHYHGRILQSLLDLGITFDLFTHTDTENHHAVAQDMFSRLLEKKYLYKEKQRLLYCEEEERFLPDRYVEGTCPHCGYEEARGDQCDNCGRLLDAVELIEPRCKRDGSTPVLRETEHYFLDLAAFSDRLLEWMADKDHWRANVIKFSRNMIAEGLRGRPITRDIEWGVPVPVEEFENKRIYVWFEAVIGYLSAAVEWANNHGEKDGWHPWWKDESALGYYFIGKDNIPFHTVIWPAMLMGYGGLNLPYDVPANEFLNLEGRGFSTSRNWAVWLPDFLSRYDPDPLRYYMTTNMPETRDSDFSWHEFLRRNNDELVATWGNLAHRVLTFTRSRFNGKVPEPGALSTEDEQLLETVASGFAPVGAEIAACHFKTALGEAMARAQAVNRYLDRKEPWKIFDEDPEAAGTTLYVALQAIDNLKLLLAPFLPFSSQRLHTYLGYEGDLFGVQRIATLQEDGGKVHTALVYQPTKDGGGWEPTKLPPGQRLREPEPLFRKLDAEIVEAERTLLEAQQAPS